VYQNASKKGKKMAKKIVFSSKNNKKQAKNGYFRLILALKTTIFQSNITVFGHKKALFRVKSAPNVPLVS